LVTYRPDIDGLRAIAVLPVLFFHAGVFGFPGGFIGVDVFFVISGYLITSLIVSEFDTTGFSIRTFYERRARRILPALFAVILACTLVAAFLFAPGDFKRMGQSAVAATLFAANVLFWTQADYFGAAAETKPLLHTWSLGVEEQFYIFFPLILVFAHRFFGLRWPLLLMPLGVASFGLSVWATTAYPMASFYLVPTRFWELLLGALLAGKLLPAVRSRASRDFLSAAGLGMILYCVVAYSERTVFPGIGAVLPCVGAALIIHAGQHGPSWIGRFLSLPPVVFVGLISYSLYLWHWPVLVFFRYGLARELTPWEGGVAVLLTVPLAMASWRYIETPFRKGFKQRTRMLFATSGTVGAAICAVGLVIHLNGGFAQRFAQAAEAPVGKETYHIGTCMMEEGQRYTEIDFQACTFGAPDAPRTVLMWGDSHSAQWISAVDRLAREYGVSVVQANISGCPPMTGFHIRAKAAQVANCLDFNRTIRERVSGFDGVIVAANWSRYEGDERYSQALAETVRWLREQPTPALLIGQSPTFALHAPTIRQLRPSGAGEADFAQSDNLRDSITNRYLETASDPGKLFVFMPHKKLCKETSCRFADGQHLLFWDDNHLSEYGSAYLSDGFREFLARIASGARA